MDAVAGRQQIKAYTSRDSQNISGTHGRILPHLIVSTNTFAASLHSLIWSLFKCIPVLQWFVWDFFLLILIEMLARICFLSEEHTLIVLTTAKGSCIPLA